MQGPPRGGSVVTNEPCFLNVVGVSSRCSSRPRPAPAPASSAESLEAERQRASQLVSSAVMTLTLTCKLS